MQNQKEVETLEKLIGQLKGIHNELSQLSKKSPKDAVNEFKLKLINKTLVNSNAVLGEDYKPFDGFEEFEIDCLPSNSDVTFVITQYIEEIERFRANNIKQTRPGSGRWAYVINDEISEIQTTMPSKLERK